MWRHAARASRNQGRDGLISPAGAVHFLIRPLPVLQSPPAAGREEPDRQPLRRRHGIDRGWRDGPGLPAYAAGCDLGPPNYIPSRTTGLRNVPIPVISTSTVSPCFMFAVAPSVPIHIMSPGYNVRQVVIATR
jgi:hypothetical protein